MLINKRTDSILSYLKQHKKATIDELSKALYASESTVRRDLTDLQKSGLIARYHGGAMILEDSGEISLFVRSEQNAQDKEQCAAIALNYLPKFNTVFIDNSSTCLALAKRLDFTNKTVITNGLQIALQLSSKRDIQLIVTGGAVNLNTSAITGSAAVRFLEMFNVDLMLSSCASLNGDKVCELSLETAQLKRTAMQQSRMHFLIVTKNKFSGGAPYLTETADKFDCIITNADDQTVKPLRERNITVYNR